MSFSPDDTRPVKDSLAAAREWLTAKGRPEQYEIVEKIMKGVDKRKLASLVKKYANLPPHSAARKALDLPYWLARYAERAAAIGLRDRKAGAVLDLGSRGNHWLAVCQHYGWKGTGLHVYPPETGAAGKPLALHADVAALLGIKLVEHAIRPQQPLPHFRTKFDLVTSFIASFHEVRESGKPLRQFGIEDWRFFLNGTGALLKFPATLHMELVPLVKLDDGTFVHDPEMLEWFRSQGAVLGGAGNRFAVTFDFAGPKQF